MFSDGSGSWAILLLVTAFEGPEGPGKDACVSPLHMIPPRLIPPEAPVTLVGGGFMCSMVFNVFIS